MKRIFTQRCVMLLCVLVCCTASLLAQITVTIPSANTNGTGGDATGARKPYGSFFGYERTALIYSAAEVGTPGTISTIAFYVNAVSSPAAAPIKIYLKERSANTFTATSTYASELSGAKLVFTGSITPGELVAGAWTVKTLDSTFYYGGTQNLEVLIETNATGGGSDPTGTAKAFRYNNTSTPNYYFQYWQQDNTAPTGNGTRSYYRPNVQFTITPPPACAGMPVSGTASATPAIVCTGGQSIISASGVNNELGITYSWLSSTDGVNYTDVSGASGSTYTATVSANTYYKRVVTCSNTSQSDTSSAVQVTIKPFYQCYCVPASSTCTANDRIDSVNFAGINNGGVLTGCSPAGYIAYSTPVGSANRLATLPISVKVGPGGTEYVAVWIDYNQNGTFEASEFKAIGSGNGVVISNTITIPGTALTGITGVRVRVKYNSAMAGGDACATLSNGETEDYLLNILPAPTCSGTPTAGATNATSNPACIGQTTTLSISGVNNVDSITYQWISSTDGVNYTVVNTATSATYVATFTGDVYYRNIVTCASTGLSDTSSPLQITASSFLNCYCAPAGTTSCSASDRIDSVNFAGINNGGTLTGCSSGAFITYNTPVGSALKGATYPINVRVGPGGTENVAVWIDYNHSGTFDTTEYRFIGTVSSSGSGANVSNTITIPATALSGVTKMRVRVRFGSTSLFAGDACSNIPNGETEDYLIDIQSPPACTAAVAGTTSASANPACVNQPITLNISGGSTDDGISYQWISSTDGVNYTPIQGANSASYTGTFTVATYYRNIVSCSYTSTNDTSSVLYVTVSPFANCYCTPAASDCTQDDRIDSVSFAGINKASVCSANGYVFYNTPVGFAYKTVTYPINIRVGPGGTENVAVWIDYDHSGTFDTTEYRFIGTVSSSGSGANVTNTVSIPANALSGVTRMRVRNRFGSTSLFSGDACLAYTIGETEDYLIDIQEPPACTNPPVAGAVTGDSTVCSGNVTVLTLSGNDIGTTLQWQTSTDSVNWTNVNAATTTTLTTDTITTSVRFYRVRVTCIDSALTSVFAVRPAPSFECFCNGFTQDCTDGDVIVNVEFGNLSNNTGYACNANSYSYFNSPVDTFYVGSDEDIDITVGDGGTENVYVWIDYNQNGLFDSVEYTYVGTGTDEIVSNSISIPAGAQTGLTLMRVRVRWNSTLNANQACFNGYTYGETEDYLIYLAPTPPCVTPVVAGTVTGPASVALDSVQTYVLTGFTGTNVRWQIATSAAGPYSTFAGINNDSITILFNAADTFYLRAFVTTIGCTSDTTLPIQIVTPKRIGDDVCDAITLNIGVNGPFTTDGATVQAGEVVPTDAGCGVQTGWCNDVLDASMWFKFTAPASGRIRVNAPDTQGDPQLALWDAATCDSLLSPTGATLLRANDDDPNYTAHGTPLFSSWIDSAICLTPGKTYWVQLDATSVSTPVVTTIVLTDLGPGPNAAFTNLDSTYCITADSVVLTPTGGTFTGTGVTGNVFNPAAAGVGGLYVITRTFYACYTYSDTVYAVLAAPTLTVDDTTDVSCHSGSNGAVAVSVTGGTTPYAFTWSNNTTSEDLSGVAAGTYTITVNDANLCSAIGSATVLEPDTLLPALDSLVNVSCPADSNGAVYITTQGGVAPYTFAWSNGDATEDLTNVPAGTYSLTVTDANGCMYMSPQIPISQPAPISVIVNSVTNLDCNGDADGAVNITITGGSAPYTYLWSNGATTQDVSNLTAGTYTPTITDSKGCVLVGQAFNITEPAALVVTVDSTDNASCSTSADGAAYITVAGGTTPYSYSWSNSTSNEDLTGVGGGTFDVTVTDSKQCAATAQAVVNANAAILVTIDSIEDVTCASGNDGEVYITAAGGTSPYSYTWSNSTVNEDLMGAAAGNYSVIVNDANGCSTTVTATIADGYALNAVVDSTDDVACNGGSTGAVYITPTNGLSPYVYSWSNSANTQDITGLMAGTYTLTLTDANGCSYNGLSATVTQATAIVITSVVTDQVGTPNNGAVNVTISGGTSPYTSVWSNAAQTEDLTAVAAGVYTTTVTDANGCTATKTDTVDFIVGITVVDGSYSINMYPNPTQGMAYVDVKLDAANDVTVEVYNVAGQIVDKVKEYGVTETRIALDLTQHAAGVYNTKITIGDRRITQRLIVNK